MIPADIKTKLRNPVVLAGGLTLLLAIWLLSGDHLSARDEAPPVQATPGRMLDTVETRWLEAESQPREQIAQGQLLPWQRVEVRAQVSGRVQQLLKQQGEVADAGEALLQLSDEGRTQQLQQARADHRLRQGELEAARSLQNARLVSPTELIRLESELARAEAELKAAELAVEYTRPAAPFSGRVDRRHVEVGDWIQAGSELMTLVNVERLRVTAQIPQQDAEQVEVGQPVRLKLLDGRRLDGEVRFVSLAADPQTRSFYVEVEARNPELWRVAGGSATLHIQLAPVSAHRLSPALLRLNTEGQLGVHIVDDDNRVVFLPVRIVTVGTDAATVSGLPERVRIITQGAGFVVPGQEVQTRSAGVRADAR